MKKNTHVHHVHPQKINSNKYVIAEDTSYSHPIKNVHKKSYVPHIIISIIAIILFIGCPIYDTMNNCIEINKNYVEKEKLKIVRAENHTIRYDVIDIKKTKHNYEFTILDDDNVVNKSFSCIKNTKIKLDESFTTPHVIYDIYVNTWQDGTIYYNTSMTTLYVTPETYFQLENTSIH